MAAAYGGYGGNVKRTTATATGSIVSSGGAHCCVEIIPSHSSSSLVPVPAKFQRHWSCTNMTITAQRPSICTWTGGHTRQDPHNFGNWKHVIPIKRTMEATRETVIIRSLSLHYETRPWPWSSLGHTRSICRGGFTVFSPNVSLHKYPFITYRPASKRSSRFNGSKQPTKMVSDFIIFSFHEKQVERLKC